MTQTILKYRLIEGATNYMTQALIRRIEVAEDVWPEPAYVYGYAWGWATLDKRV